MALEGFKYWADGEPVTGVDANTFLMSQSVMRFENASDRDSALARTLTTGMVAYLKDTTTLQIYDGTSWVDVALGTAGVTDHGALTGLADDDHTQYHNDTRGDARYLQLSGGTLTGSLTTDNIIVSPNNSIYYSVAGNTSVDPVVWIDAQNTNVDLMRVGGGAADYSLSADYGVTLRYLGSGTGNNNAFEVVMDNQQGTAVTAITILQDGKVGINTGSPIAPLHVDGEIIHASQWAGVSGPTSWASAYRNNWNQARDQGSFMTAGSTGITINQSGRYHVIAGQRCNSTTDAYFGIGESGSRTALENRTTGIWSHDHAGYPNQWTQSVYVGYLVSGEVLTSGAPNSSNAGRLTFSTAGWAGYMVAIWLGD